MIQIRLQQEPKDSRRWHRIVKLVKMIHQEFEKIMGHNYLSGNQVLTRKHL